LLLLLLLLLLKAILKHRLHTYNKGE